VIAHNQANEIVAGRGMPVFSLTRTWDLLWVMGGRAARGLAAVEPRSLVRHAQRNAASAVALAHARRLEEGEGECWVAARLMSGSPKQRPRRQEVTALQNLGSSNPGAAQDFDRLPYADSPDIDSAAPTASAHVGPKVAQR
jgi:hypothetical protein